LEEVAEIAMGQSPPSSTYNDKGNGLPFFQGKAEFTELHPVVRKWCSEPNRIAEANDILVSVRAPVGATNIANQKCCIGRGLAAIRYRPQHRFLFYYLRLVERKLDEKGTGTTFRAISGDVLRELDFPLPPLPEQHRIVEKIEALFSELENGIEQLTTAKQQLKVYRQAVLKWAFEGKLTNEEIKEGELPEGWRWVKLKDVADKITDGEHFRPNTQENGIPFLSAKDVRDEGVSFDEPLFIAEETATKAMQRCNPERGDIVIVSRGATVGRMCIVNTDVGFSLLGSVILIKVNKSVNSRFINYVLKSPIAYQKMIAISGATAQQAIYLRDIKNIGIPFCSIEQQYAVVQAIEDRLSVSDKLEESVTQSLHQAEALRRSILKKAFEGKLVPQDPMDEPASVLLERIRTEHT